MTISGRTKLIAHLGYPTESFKAPMIYNPYFEKHAIDAVVVPMGCKPEDYATFLKLVFKLSNIHGALVTMPHKVTTVSLLDEVKVRRSLAPATQSALAPAALLSVICSMAKVLFAAFSARAGRWQARA
jgi:shikimate dehydrogenase